MANPQKENGYTGIANEVLEKLCLFEFPDKTGIPLKLVLFTIRKTWGYQKKSDKISLTQYEQGIKSNRPTVVHWLNYLVKANILLKSKSDQNGTVYSFNKNWDDWKWGVKASELVKVRAYSSMRTLTKSSMRTLTHNRKKKYTKEILEKTDKKDNKQVPELLKAFETINIACKRYYGNTTQRQACSDLIETYGYDRVKGVIEKTLPITNKIEYMPTITTPLQLWEKWSNLESGIIRFKSKANKDQSTVAFT